MNMRQMGYLLLLALSDWEILRLVTEVSEGPYASIESMWPVLKPEKHVARVNVFGTWVSCSKPLVVGKQPQSKKKAGDDEGQIIVCIDRILVWPVDVAAGASAFENGVRIPLEVFHFLRTHVGVDLATACFTFAKRGYEFYMQIVKATAKTLNPPGL